MMNWEWFLSSINFLSFIYLLNCVLVACERIVGSAEVKLQNSLEYTLRTTRLQNEMSPRTVHLPFWKACMFHFLKAIPVPEDIIQWIPWLQDGILLWNQSVHFIILICIRTVSPGWSVRLIFKRHDSSHASEKMYHYFGWWCNDYGGQPYLKHQPIISLLNKSGERTQLVVH